jgi:hypothetical protein
MKTTSRSPSDLTDSTPAAIKCTIFYEDRRTGLHGRHFAERLAAELGVACDCESLWRTEVVELFPAVGDRAAGEAAKSDVIVFALRGDHHFSPSFKRWVENWFALTSDHNCSVTALFDPDLATPLVTSETRDFLCQRCAAAHVEFFANDPSPAIRRRDRRLSSN